MRKSFSFRVIVDIRRRQSLFLFCRVESDDTHEQRDIFCNLLNVTKAEKGRNGVRDVKSIGLRFRNCGRDDLAAAETVQRKWKRKRAALERDLKYYAVQYFVGDCALDRALLPCWICSRFSSCRCRRVLSNRSTLKSC